MESQEIILDDLTDDDYDRVRQQVESGDAEPGAELLPLSEAFVILIG